MPKTRLIMFGAGLIGREVLPRLGKHIQVVAFSDNDTGKQGTRVSGVEVIAPDDIPQRQFDFVLVSSTAVSDIYQQLLELGIARDKIILMDDADEHKTVFPWDAVIFLLLVIVVVFILTALLVYLW